MNLNRILAVVCLLLIVLYGIFRIWVLNFYTDLLSNFIDIDILNEIFNDLSNKKRYRSEIAGWIIYYPTYLLLHVLFIQILFYKTPKTRNLLSVGLVSLVGLILLMILIGKYFDLNMLYRYSYRTFKNLFGLPFILLAIEGGRVLYNDIMELQSKN